MKRHTERFGEYGRTINGLLFCTAIDRRNVRHPVLAEEAPHTALASLGKRPLWNRNRRINHDIRMRDEIDMARHLSILLPLHALTSIPHRRNRPVPPPAITYQRAEPARVQAPPRRGDARPALCASARSRLRPTLVALPPM